MSEHTKSTAGIGRPDPFSVPRRPMAQGRADVVFARQRARPEPEHSPLFTADGPDLDAWYRLIDAAETVIEGADDGRVFDGSAVIHLAAPADARVPGAAAVTRDARLRTAIEDRVRRELAALLGPLTPAAPTITVRAHPTATHLRIDADVEGRLPAGVHDPDERA